MELFRGKDFRPYTGWVESEDEIRIYRKMLNRRVQGERIKNSQGSAATGPL
jgi:hypothetical protein